MAGCTRGLIPSVLMLFALLVGDELVTFGYVDCGYGEMYQAMHIQT